jgi:carboxymethylenebutenolidase
MAATAAPAELARWTSDGAAISGALVRPQEDGMRPTLLLLHEWWGLTDRVKELARKFAAEGYVVLAPDLYSRQGSKVTQDPAEAAALMNAVSSQRILRDLNAGVAYLKSLPFVDPLKIGVVGFSMGGTFALTQVGHNSDLKAAVVFYGKIPPDETFRYLLSPIQYHEAKKDAWVTRQEVERLRQGMAKHGKTGEIHVYPEADHGFFNEAQPEHRPADSKLAWERALAFLARHVA